ncbi:MAG: protein-L-isoaspartate(D-aspartate) O-methyltransferase [Gammaproteobacteria bacterium]|nr:protein-L-isoaspartate(D-aspartate) O-methyltransferase [Gammaproteobacteria bacterium]MCK5263392.1 protein-L-isoaspartate(D-aspartate) O-methyltransferase [Gammaproteobacteria bacterium]
MNKDIKHLIEDIESEVQYTSAYIGKSKLDKRVMQTMARVPREEFVPKTMQYAAYDNGPLPIGHGQTISQPYIVALMSDLLSLKPEDRVLEIGTGSGYQTAILAELCEKVFSIERIAELSRQAEERFSKLNYKNIETRVGNGYQGWQEHAPYDGIIVTAAATHIPQPLIDQLKPGGNLVIPVAMSHFSQSLMRVKKDLDGEIETQDILNVVFVPLVNDEQDKSNSVH